MQGILVTFPNQFTLTSVDNTHTILYAIHNQYHFYVHVIIASYMLLASYTAIINRI